MSIFSTRIVSEQFKANMRDFARNAKANFKRFFLEPVAAGSIPAVMYFSWHVLSQNPATIPLKVLLTSFGIGAAAGIAYATYNAITKGAGQTYTDIYTYEPRTAKQMNRALQKELNNCMTPSASLDRIDTLLKTMESYNKLNVFEASAPFVAKLLLKNKHKNNVDQNHVLEAVAMIAQKVPGILNETTPAHLDAYLSVEVNKSGFGAHLFRQQNSGIGGTPVLGSKFMETMGNLHKARPDLFKGLSDETAMKCAKKLVHESNIGSYKSVSSEDKLNEAAPYLLQAGKLFKGYLNKSKAGNYLINSALEHEQEQIDAAKTDYKKAVQIMMDVKRNGAVFPHAKPDAERSKQTLQTRAARMKLLRENYAV